MHRQNVVGERQLTALTLQGGDPHRIARIGEDYVELLPGRGRSDLTSVLRLKLQRRLGAAAAES